MCVPVKRSYDNSRLLRDGSRRPVHCCVQRSTQHDETTSWPMKVEHEVKLDRNETSLLRWTRGYNMKERKIEIGESLGLETGSLSINGSRLQWFSHAECKAHGIE